MGSARPRNRLTTGNGREAAGGAMCVLGFPALFAFLGSRDRQMRPWQCVAAGAVLGASVILADASILGNL